MVPVKVQFPHTVAAIVLDQKFDQSSIIELPRQDPDTLIHRILIILIAQTRVVLQMGHHLLLLLWPLQKLLPLNVPMIDQALEVRSGCASGKKNQVQLRNLLRMRTVLAWMISITVDHQLHHANLSVAALQKLVGQKTNAVRMKITTHQKPLITHIRTMCQLSFHLCKPHRVHLMRLHLLLHRLPKTTQWKIVTRTQLLQQHQQVNLSGLREKLTWMRTMMTKEMMKRREELYLLRVPDLDQPQGMGRLHRLLMGMDWV
jgi:hypothetical protein